MVRSGEYRWEYSALAGAGNWFWKAIVDPALRSFAADELSLLRRIRGVIQAVLLMAMRGNRKKSGRLQRKRVRQRSFGRDARADHARGIGAV